MTGRESRMLMRRWETGEQRGAVGEVGAHQTPACCLRGGGHTQWPRCQRHPARLRTAPARLRAQAWGGPRDPRESIPGSRRAVCRSRRAALADPMLPEQLGCTLAETSRRREGGPAAARSGEGRPFPDQHPKFCPEGTQQHQ